MPLIKEIWRSHQPLRGLVHAMTPSLFEQHILSKPYFDRNGFIIAVKDDTPLGFIHVGFGANDDLTDLSMKTGVVCMLMVSKSKIPDQELRVEVAKQLIKKAEAFTSSHGGSQMMGGGSFPLNPFYLGFYGGSRLPGILCEDQFTIGVFESLNYSRHVEYGIWQRELSQFRTSVNRDQRQIRRDYNIHAEFDPPPRSWWEACTLGHAERMKFELVKRSTNKKCGEVTFWDMQPLATHWGVHAAGMFDLLIQPEHRRSGMATFLIGEALRQLREHGSTVAEVQTQIDDQANVGLFRKLGFEEIDHGFSFVKQLPR